MSDAESCDFHDSLPTLQTIIAVRGHIDARYQDDTSSRGYRASSISRHLAKELYSEEVKKMALILLIDDDPITLEILQDTLVTAGHSVKLAKNGRDGMTQFDEFQADIVITDIFMPEMEGLETILTIRHQQPSIKIIAISGGSLVGEIDALSWASLHGADFALHKPVAEEDLLQAVKACLPTKVAKPPSNFDEFPADCLV